MIEDLYEKYHAELIRWCRRMTQNESAAEDLVQEAFYRALHHTQELDGMDLAQGRAWLYRTVKNLFVDRFRRERREAVMAELPGGSTVHGLWRIGKCTAPFRAAGRRAHPVYHALSGRLQFQGTGGAFRNTAGDGAYAACFGEKAFAERVGGLKDGEKETLSVEL